MENRTGKKRIIILAALVIIVVVVIIGAVLLLGKKSNEKDLRTSLTEMGRNFYENFYYEQVGSSADEKTTLLSKFTTIGIKVDLENLERYNNGEFSETIKKFKNNKTKEKCSKTSTKAIIYPKSPYGKTDYQIETELDCGFENK